MTKLATSYLCAAIVCFLASMGLGQISIQVGASSTLVSSTVDLIDGSYVVSAEVRGSPDAFVFVTATSVPIRISSISIRPSPLSPFASQSISLFVHEAGGTISNLGSISKVGNAGALVIGEIDISGSIGSLDAPSATTISVQAINSITSDSYISAAISASGSTAAGISGAIGSVISDSGPILGSITAATNFGNAFVGEVESGSDIGTLERPFSISSPNGVRTVECDLFFGSISANSDGVAGGSLSRLETRSGGFVGEISGNHIFGTGLEDGVTIAGDFSGQLNLNFDVQDPILIRGSVLAGSLFNIPGEIRFAPTNTSQDTGSITVEEAYRGNLVLGANGLKSQVIINSTNTISNPWTGTLSIGGQTLSMPRYELASSTLGGGSVGVAPFYLNQADCLPASPCLAPPCLRNIPIISRSSAAAGLKFRFYGPVALPTSALPRLYMYKANAWGEKDLNGPDYSGVAGLTVTAEPGNGRGVVVSFSAAQTIPSTFPNGRYVLELGPGGVVCDGVTGQPSVMPFSYGLIIANDSSAEPGTDFICGSADFDCDGDVGTDADIEAFFRCLAGQCFTNACGVETSDFNGDGDLGTDADIEAFFRVIAGGSCDPNR